MWINVEVFWLLNELIISIKNYDYTIQDFPCIYRFSQQIFLLVLTISSTEANLLF